MEDGTVVQLDRWSLRVEPNQTAGAEPDEQQNDKVSPMWTLEDDILIPLITGLGRYRIKKLTGAGLSQKTQTDAQPFVGFFP